MSSVIASLLCFFLALVQPCSGASLTAESSTMRREQPIHGHHRSATMVEVNSKAHLYNTHGHKVMEEDFCKYDFPLGLKDTKGGCNNTEHELALSEKQCIKAGDMAGARTEHSNFKLDTDDEKNTHPKYCFLDKCRDKPDHWCYYYNGIGGEPDGTTKATPNSAPVHVGFTGTSVCSRKRYKFGTTFGSGTAPHAKKDDTAADDAAAATTTDDAAGATALAESVVGGALGCPAGYDVIMDSVSCFDSAGCLDLCSGQYFNIGERNGSRHLDFPVGCFKNTLIDNCVYFNPPSAMGNTLNNTAKITGVPICNVTTTTKVTQPEDVKKLF